MSSTTRRVRHLDPHRIRGLHPAPGTPL